MISTNSFVRANLFARLAGDHLAVWDALVEQDVIHTTFGRGTVVEVEQRSDGIFVWIAFHDDTTPKRMFQATAFANGQYFQAVMVPEYLRTQLQRPEAGVAGESTVNHETNDVAAHPAQQAVIIGKESRPARAEGHPRHPVHARPVKGESAGRVVASWPESPPRVAQTDPPDARPTVPLRLVVFDTPDPRSLLTALQRVYPDVAFHPARSWRYQPYDNTSVVPIWYWAASLDDLQAHASELLRAFVYPLVVSGAPYCVAFPFSRQVLEPQELEPESMDWLDLEDIGLLLQHDAYSTSFMLLPSLADRIPQTPIEIALGKALAEAGIPARPQVKIGSYRADFLIEWDGRRVVVEADGYGYHDPEQDRRRDAALQQLGVEEIVRFTGRQIYRDARRCAEEVRSYLARQTRHSAGPSGMPPDHHTRLDDSQRRAVEHVGGAARILAPAGSGKTTTMVHRVAELVRRGVPPSAILVLAFNKKAADQLVSRLEGLGIPVSRKLVDPDHAGVMCATFNAFGYRYQRQVMGHAMGIETDGATWRRLMDRALRSTGIDLSQLRPKRGSDPIGEFLKALARVRADLQCPEDIEVEIESYGENPSEIVPFEAVYRAFQRIQIDTNIQSLDDQIYLAVRDLLATPSLRRLVQQRFEHVLVDEFQDLNGTQLALVDIVSRPHRNLFVVGDDDQLIYGWRFAKPTNILDFHDRVPPKPLSATFTLSTNYRCSRAVVTTSRRLIDHNRIREPKDIAPRADADPGAVRFHGAATWGERATAICEFLQSEKARLGCDWRQLAVLCRYKSQQPLVAMALDAAKIPRTPLLAYRLFTDRAAEVLRAYLNLVIDPGTVSGRDLQTLLNQPNRYLRDDDVARVAGASDPWAALQAWSRREDVPRQVPALVAQVHALHAKLRSSFEARQLIEEVLSEFALERYWTDEAKPASGKGQDEAGPLQVVKTLRLLASDWPTPQQFLQEWDRLAQREAERFDMARDTLMREESENADQVVIGTIHAAKGREYHSVVIADYEPDLTRMSDEQREEERRVLYVGVTRAKDSLLLTIDRTKPAVHPFIREMILPPSRGEAAQIRSELEKEKAQEPDLIVSRTQHRQELDTFANGTEERRCEDRLRELRGQQQQLKARIDELSKLQQTGGMQGLWWALSGQLARFGQEVERYRVEHAKQQAEIEDLNRRLILLRSDPHIFSRTIADQLRGVEKQLAENRTRQAALSARLAELDLLGLR